MNISEQIEADIISALKDKNQSAVLALRMLKTALANAAIAARPDELTEQDVIKVVRSELKKRHESIESFKQGGRDDLVQKEEAELVFVNKYLPPELSEDDLTKIVTDAVAEVGANGPSDFGAAMGLAMKKVGTQANGDRVAAVVKSALAAK